MALENQSTLSSVPFVALPVEVKKRELDSKCYLSYRFLCRGIPVLLGARPSVHRQLQRRGGPFVYFHNGGPTSVEKLHDFVSSLGGTMALLEEEGGVYPPGERRRDILLSRNPENLLARLSLYFSWGQWQRDSLMQHRTGLNTSNCLVSGHPRFDLRKPEFLSCYQESVDWKTSPILVNTSFGIFNNQRPLERIMERSKAVMSRSLLQRYYDYQSDTLPRFVEAVKCMARDQSQRSIIVRPHPAERPEYYRNALEGIGNVVVDAETSVHEVASGAVAVVHHDCTTAIEAAFFGHQPISFIDDDFEADLTQSLPVEISRRAADSEALCRAVREEIEVRCQQAPAGLSEQHAQLIKPTIGNTDFDSASFIADTVAEAIPDLPIVEHAGIGRIQSLRSNAARLVAALTAWTPQARLVRRKMPRIESAEVEHYLRAIDGVVGKKLKYRIESDGGSLFLVPET